MRFSPLLEQLIKNLCYLPGVGQKTAQRMAFQLLTHGREQGKHIAESLQQALSHLSHCQACRIFTESPLCEICLAEHRDHSLLCIVESPLVVSMLEQTGHFKGKYFVTFGLLSPLDGMGPEEIGINQLKMRLEQEMIQEVIIATNTTVEGEATSHYIAELIKQLALKTMRTIKVTRIARGVSVGNGLEYSDLGTISLALTGRVPL